MDIEQVSEATEELLIALQRLIPQLGIHKIPPSRGELAALIHSESTTLLVARESYQNGTFVVGCLTLIIYRVPTGIRSVIEDIVVDERYRRQGIAQQLISLAVDLARRAGAGGISLTSNPERTAANELYQKMGFQRRKTNPYIYTLK
jgi:ribosomal protein S18 acetylase RimI-like enzyme